MNPLRSTLLACLTLMAASAFAGSLTPVDRGAFFIRPEAGGGIDFTVSPEAPAKEIPYEVTDYSGNAVTSGKAPVSGNRVSVGLNLKPGYYELCFPQEGKKFGIIAIPDRKAPADGFWQLDAGLSWSKWDFETKQRIVSVLLDKGISGFRERLAWPALDTPLGCDPAAGVFGKIRNEVYPSGEGRVLELFQDSPGHLRFDAANPFAVDLGAAFASWRKICAAYRQSWSALELWNEPFFSGKGLPADQYVPVAKAVAAAAGPVEVAAGCFSPSIAVSYLDGCAENGLLDVTDVVTLHFYGKPETMNDLIRFYRKWLTEKRNGDMPLWVSESGTPGQLGEFGRPGLKSDLESARDTVMRAVECRALGVARFYAFYLQYHIEGVISWGMTDREASPQRPLAAWLFAAQAIADRPYLGRLEQAPAGVLLNRVFGEGANATVVLYTRIGETVRLPFPVREYAGIDGRRIAPNADGTVTAADGILYAQTAKQAVKLAESPEDAALFACASKRNPPRQIRKLVLQPVYFPAQCSQATNSGYFVKQDAAGKFKAAVNVANLGETPVEAEVALDFPGANPRRVSVGAMKSARVEWELNLSDALKNNPPLALAYAATAGDCADRAVIRLYPEPARRIYPVLKTGEAILPDGRKDEAIWAKAPKADQLTCLDDNPAGTALPCNDFRAAANFAWGDVGLYFFIEVDDPRHEPPQSAALSWQKDSVQIAFSQENSAYDINQFEWGFFLDEKGAHRVLFRSSLHQPLSDATKVGIRRDEQAGKTFYEGVIAWLDLGSLKAVNERAGSRFRLSFIVNDANAGSRRWLEWSPGIAKSKKPSEYPELVLCDAAPEPERSNLLKGWQAAAPENVSQVNYMGAPAIRLLDRKDSVLTRRIDAPQPSGKPVILSFLLASTEFYKHKGTGFSLKAGFYDSETQEGYECWIAPDKLYAKRTGFAIANSDGTLVQLGIDDSRFPVDGKFYKITLFYDPVNGQLKLFLEKDGENLLLAEGNGKKILKNIDQIRIAASGWGAGPLLFREIAVTR